jgi:hypothetical protein
MSEGYSASEKDPRRRDAGVESIIVGDGSSRAGRHWPIGMGRIPMSTTSPQEAKDRYIAKMGPKPGTQFNELWRDVATVHTKWLEYLHLYDTKESLDLLNRAAPRFFRMIQDIMWNDIVLHVARLTDKTKGVLSVWHLPKLVNNVNVKGNVEDLVKEAVDKSKFCTEWRHNYIAHRNLELATDPKATQLDPGDKKQLDDALDSITAILNAVSAHYHLDPEKTDFRLQHHIDGAEVLLSVLSLGVKAAADRNKQILRQICPWA